jgi:multicomponent Na+:H+ antiporter subunit B
MKIAESFILRAVAALVFFVVNLFAIYLLLRGHNLPGGGFIGGLGSALSFLLLSLAFGVEWTERALRIDSLQLAAIGLAIAVVSSMAPWIVGDPFLQQYNWKFSDLPFVGDLAIGTPLSFDLGVFIAVVGVSTKLIFMLARSISGVGALSAASAKLYAAAVEEPIEGPGVAANEQTEERR